MSSLNSGLNITKIKILIFQKTDLRPDYLIGGPKIINFLSLSIIIK
jgi:hypothetical protein